MVRQSLQAYLNDINHENGNFKQSLFGTRKQQYGIHDLCLWLRSICKKLNSVFILIPSIRALTANILHSGEQCCVEGSQSLYKCRCIFTVHFIMASASCPSNLDSISKILPSIDPAQEFIWGNWLSCQWGVFDLFPLASINQFYSLSSLLSKIDLPQNLDFQSLLMIADW